MLFNFVLVIRPPVGKHAKPEVEKTPKEEKKVVEDKERPSPKRVKSRKGLKRMSARKDKLHQ